MSRVAAIIIKDQSVALIKRIREDRIYYLFPGGTVETGETNVEACTREIKEELGLEIIVEKLIAEVTFNQNTQYYYQCRIVAGIFGSGAGEEYQPGLPEARGRYEPVWMNIADIQKHDVRPVCICNLINGGYQGEPKRFADLGGGVCVEQPSR